MPTRDRESEDQFAELELQQLLSRLLQRIASFQYELSVDSDVEKRRDALEEELYYLRAAIERLSAHGHMSRQLMRLLHDVERAARELRSTAKRIPAADLSKLSPSERLVRYAHDLPGRTRGLLEVDICIPDANVDATKAQLLQRAVDNFLDIAGFEIDSAEKPEFGSWFRTLYYAIKKSFSAAKDYAQRSLNDMPAAEREAKLAEAVKDLLSAIDDYDNACVRIGEILVVKTTKRGKTNVIVERVSKALAKELEANPLLLRDPQSLLQHFKKRPIPDESG